MMRKKMVIVEGRREVVGRVGRVVRIKILNEIMIVFFDDCFNI